MAATLLTPGAAAAIPAPAEATTFIVDEAGDGPIDSPSGCAETGDQDSGGTCTLREAIIDANTNGNGADAIDKIMFALDPGTTIYLTRDFAGDFEPNPGEGDLDIVESVSIDGAGITVDASQINNDDVATYASLPANQDRVFDIIDPDRFAPLDVTLRGLTISGGFTQPGQHGGGVRAIDCGAGVTVLLDDVTVSGNMADPGSTYAFSRGGGVYAQQVSVTIQGSTISGNLAQQGGGVAIAANDYENYPCGGVDYAGERSASARTSSRSILVLTDTSVTGNAAVRNVHGAEPDDGLGSQGAGVWSDADLTMTRVVVADNGVPLAAPITGPDGITEFPGEQPWEGGGVFIGPDDRSLRQTRPYVLPTLTVSTSLIGNNTAVHAGGGVYAHNTFLGSAQPGLLDSAVLDNTVDSGMAENLPLNGGGGLALLNSSGSIVNTTVAGNTADDGSAVLNATNTRSYIRSPRLSAYQVTVTDNGPAVAGPAFAQDPPSGSIQVDVDGVEDPDAVVTEVYNSILQSPASGAPTCVEASGFATIRSLGGNTDDDGSCGLDKAADASGVTHSLTRQGGPTAGDDPGRDVPVMALGANAEAIDAALDQPDYSGVLAAFAGTGYVVACDGTTTDQIGTIRPQDGDNDGTAACDRGSFEYRYQRPVGTPTVDVGVTKTGPTEAVVGDPVQFTIEVTNARNRADQVVLTDTLPSGLTLVGASAPCTASGASISCDLGSIRSTEAVTVTVDATADGEGTFTNTACASTSDPDLNRDNDCDSHTLTVAGDMTERVEGPERVTTAVAGSQVVFDDGVASAVVLTRADDFPDAQAGTPLAIAKNAAMLLSQSDALSQASEEEIQRVLAPGGTVYLLGGEAALSQAVEDRVVELGYTPVRLAGSNRFATAVAIAEELGGPGTALLADGFDFPAAVVAGAAAVVAGDSDFAQTGDVGAAVLLTAVDRVPPETQAYLDGLVGPELIPVGDGAAAAFPDEDDAITGADRYELSVNVAERFFPAPFAIGVATGANFADALVGGSLVGRPSVGPGPMLLTDADDLPDTVGGFVGANTDTISRLFIFGGSAAITPPVEDELNTILGIEPTE